MKLRDVTCRNAKAKEKPYKLSDGYGLYLLVNPKGSKLWRAKYRFLGKEKTLSIGEYPIISLLDARKALEQNRKLLASGTDPSASKKEDKRQKSLNSKNTFKAIALEWRKNNLAKWTERHATYILRRLEKDVFPAIGSRPIADIKPPEMMAIFRKMEERGVGESVRRMKGVCGQVFSYGVGILEQMNITLLQTCKGF